MRTATDILLDLEKKIDLISAALSSDSLLLKVLNNKILKLEKAINTSKDVNEILKEESVSVAPQPQVIQNKPSSIIPPPPLTPNGLKKLDTPNKLGLFKTETGEMVLGRLESYQSDKVEDSEDESQAKRRSNRPGFISKAIPINQQILYSDGKPAAMVSVEIFRSGNIFKQLKTVANGKWNTSLEPGTYTIKLSKKENSTRPEVSYTFDMDVPSSDRPVSLDTLKF